MCFLRIKVELADKNVTSDYKPLESLPLLEDEFQDIADSCPKADISLSGLLIDSQRIVPKLMLHLQRLHSIYPT